MARIRVASTGYNVDSDKRYLSLDSDISTLMIIAEPSIAGFATEYTHGLGYLPTTIEFFNYDTAYWYPVGSFVFDQDGTLAGVISPMVSFDTDKIYIDNTDSLPLKILVSGNSADNSVGSGKNTAAGKLKIAKDGLNVPDITDVRQFKFCSGLDTLKKDLSLSGSTQLVSDGSFTKVEITHSLEYVPLVMARLVSNTYDSVYDGSMLPINMAIFDLAPIGYYITSTKIVFFVYNVAGTFNINYNLYRNKIA